METCSSAAGEHSKVVSLFRSEKVVKNTNNTRPQPAKTYQGFDYKEGSMQFNLMGCCSTFYEVDLRGVCFDRLANENVHTYQSV